MFVALLLRSRARGDETDSAYVDEGRQRAKKRQEKRLGRNEKKSIMKG
jgi:hypothetical protein